MAEIRSIHTDKRRTSDRNRQTYVNGTAVRKLQVVEEPKRRRGRQAQRPRIHRARREKVRYLSIGYSLFLTAASIVALWVCAGYLKLQADNSARMKNIAALEARLSELKAENDDEYNRVTTSVDLEKVREIANLFFRQLMFIHVVTIPVKGITFLLSKIWTRLWVLCLIAG